MDKRLMIKLFGSREVEGFLRILTYTDDVFFRLGKC